MQNQLMVENRKGKEKENLFTSDWYSVVYRLPKEGPDDDIIVESAELGVPNNHLLSVSSIDYKVGNAKEDQEKIMGDLTEYWVGEAKKRKMDAITFNIPTILNVGYIRNSIGFLAAARLGFENKQGGEIIIASFRKMILQLDLADYKQHQDNIVKIEKVIERFKSENKSFNFTDSLLTSPEEESASLLVDGHTELPFYSGRVLWEGFTGHLAFYKEGENVRIKIFEEEYNEFQGDAVELLETFVVTDEKIGLGVERMKQFIEEVMGMQNAISIPCVNLRELLKKQKRPFDTKKAAEELMSQFVEKGYSVKSVEEEAVKCMKPLYVLKMVEADFSGAEGFYFPLLEHFVCISYTPYEDAFVSRIEKLYAQVVETKEEVAGFYQKVVLEKILSN